MEGRRWGEERRWEYWKGIIEDRSEGKEERKRTEDRSEGKRKNEEE